MKDGITHTVQLNGTGSDGNPIPTEKLIMEQLAALRDDVSFLRETVERLLGGMVDAQNSGGMVGMMSRQMFPDMTAFAPVQKG